MSSFRDATVLQMNIHSTNHLDSRYPPLDSQYRVLIGNEIKYIFVAPNTLDKDALLFPLADLPSPPTNRDRNIGHISRNPETGTLAASFVKQQLKCICEMWHPETVEYTSLTLEKRFTANVRLVSYKQSSHFDKVLAVAKFACFELEIPQMERETRAYKLLAGTSAAPLFLGHITEDGRPTGLLLEKLEGRAAEPQDLEACRTSLKKVHAMGLLHGDVNRYNFVVGEDGVKMVDFENSKISNDSAAMQKELDNLPSQLEEETGRGGQSMLIPADVSIEAFKKLPALEKEKIQVELREVMKREYRESDVAGIL